MQDIAIDEIPFFEFLLIKLAKVNFVPNGTINDGVWETFNRAAGQAGKT